MTPEEYWRGNSKLLHITPPGERHPEAGLFPILQSVVKGSVFEFGCGDGRLSSAFAAAEYTGYDINQEALRVARLNNPKHRYIDSIEGANTFLAFTVLLHVPDREIIQIIDIAKQYKRIVIGEIMGRRWRRGGNPPVFNRELTEYTQMIGRKCETIAIPYPRYNCDLTLAVFE